MTIGPVSLTVVFTYKYSELITNIMNDMTEADLNETDNLADSGMNYHNYRCGLYVRLGRDTNQFILISNILILPISILVFVKEKYQYCNIRAIYSSNMKRPYFQTILDYFGNILLKMSNI